VIVCKSPAELERMKAANALVAAILGELRTAVVPGATTAELDALAEDRVRAAGAEPAFKGYHGYPATICASVNEEVVHGIPSRRPLVEGDILSVDLGVLLEGFYGDAAVTLPVGRVSEEAAALLRVTEESLHRAIACVCTARPTGSAWSASSSGTASAGSCTRTRRSRTTGRPAAGRGWPRGWCSRSSRWSTRARRR
jgi:methionyl aminopeptidase